MRNRILAALAIGVLLVPALVVAHHSATNYDTAKQITLEGTVTDFKLSNPHPYVHFQAKDGAGNVVEWVGESASPPARWYNSGWRTNALKVGDEITITGNPGKQGRKILRIRKIVKSDGQEWIDGAQGQ